MLRELLRRAGGGSVIMLDADGNVWSHHLAAAASGAAAQGRAGAGREC